MSEWISVKDRLPEDGLEVLVFCDGRICVMDMYGTDWWCEGYHWDGDRPTHWMPLPEPPSE